MLLTQIVRYFKYQYFNFTISKYIMNIQYNMRIRTTFAFPLMDISPLTSQTRHHEPNPLHTQPSTALFLTFTQHTINGYLSLTIMLNPSTHWRKNHYQLQGTLSSTISNSNEGKNIQRFYILIKR